LVTGPRRWRLPGRPAAGALTEAARQAGRGRAHECCQRCRLTAAAGSRRLPAHGGCRPSGSTYSVGHCLVHL